jgi:putative transposase
MLTHVRSAFTLPNNTYGSPRMTRDLQDKGFAIGRRRTARLMRENHQQARHKRRFKRPTNSQHSWPLAPNIINQDFAEARLDEK